ncbi:MAG TPA: insulinase family protein [Candidatus Aminicenantes bacterium]|nr:insulinase family protein [Candidatus Aminicenantes bacterium]
MKRSILALLVLGALVIGTGCSTTQTKTNPEIMKIPEIQYETYQLDNGLKIYVVEDHAVPLVKFEIWYNVGAIDETERISGISHMLEHTMFLGTESLGKDKVHHLTKQVGGWANAGTYYDFTMFEEEVPSAKLELAMAIEADRMRNLKIDPEEFAREQQVVAQERRMRTENNFFVSSMEKIQSMAFTKHPLHHTIIGWMDSILGYTVKDIRDYYTQYYSPNNAVVAVSGDVKPEEVFALAQKYFGDYEPREITRLGIVEPEQTEERFIKIEKVTQVPLIGMMYKIPRGNDPDIVALNALNAILVNNATSRVNSVLKNEKHLIMQAGSFSFELRDPSYLFVYLIPMSVKSMDSVKEAFDAEVQRLIDEGVTEEELAAVKKAALKSKVFELKNKSGFASQLAINTVRFDDPELFKKSYQQLEALTGDDITAAARRYLVPQKRTVGYVVPKGK